MEVKLTGGKGKGRQKDGHIGDGNITLVNQRTINDDLPVGLVYRKNLNPYFLYRRSNFYITEIFFLLSRNI